MTKLTEEAPSKIVEEDSLKLEKEDSSNLTSMTNEVNLSIKELKKIKKELLLSKSRIASYILLVALLFSSYKEVKNDAKEKSTTRLYFTTTTTYSNGDENKTTDYQRLASNITYIEEVAISTNEDYTETYKTTSEYRISDQTYDEIVANLETIISSLNSRTPYSQKTIKINHSLINSINLFTNTKEYKVFSREQDQSIHIEEYNKYKEITIIGLYLFLVSLVYAFVVEMNQCTILESIIDVIKRIPKLNKEQEQYYESLLKYLYITNTKYAEDEEYKKYINSLITPYIKNIKCKKRILK